MKIRVLLIYSYLIFVSLLSARYPDTIHVNTKKVKGFGPFPLNVGIVHEMSENNPWLTTVPDYKGMPEDLENLMFAAEQTDFMQHTYQNYIAGKISGERFNELKQAWNWYPDESEYSEDFIKVDIGIVAGYDSAGTLMIKIEKNNNYDFSDDEYFTLPEKLPGQNYWERYNDLLPFEVSYEFYDGKEKKESRVWMYLDYSPILYNMTIEQPVPIELSYAFAEHHQGEFTINSIKYYAAVKSGRAVFRDGCKIKIWTDETDSRQSETDEGIHLNGHVRVGDYYYRFDNVNIDGSLITLIKDESVEERGGSEVGMKAINFTANSISGNTIELNKLKGNIVVLDFWGTWCAPCREEIPKLKSLYEQYKDANFTLIGIANDDIESLHSFVKENKLDWEQIIQSSDKSIINSYNVVAYPTTFLIDENGIIIEKGLRAENLMSRLDELIDR